jgi:lysozyme family protein
MAKFDCKQLLEDEGKFVNDPDDPGGATNRGITLKFLKTLSYGDFNGDGVIDWLDLASIDDERACMIYKREFFEKYNYDKIDNQELALKMLNLSVNIGASRPNKFLQQAVNELNRDVNYEGSQFLACDGILGNRSIDQINHLYGEKLLALVIENARQFYIDLVKKRPSSEKFLKGWLARASRI